jgi:hypothetical protein
MGLAAEYSKALHKHANFYAAWFPAAAPFRIGDYGVIRDGVFEKIGHLDEFGIEIKTESGEPTPSLDFMTEGTKSIAFVGGAELPASALPVADVEAKLTFAFDRKNSFVVKAEQIQMTRMSNIRQVADTLAQLRRSKRFSHKWRVVSATYTGHKFVVLMSSEADTRVEFSGKASALKQLNVGNVELKPSVNVSSDAVLKTVGETGVLGLGLFKLKQFGSGLQVLAEGELSDEEREMEEDWGDELESDI